MLYRLALLEQYSLPCRVQGTSPENSVALLQLVLRWVGETTLYRPPTFWYEMPIWYEMRKCSAQWSALISPIRIEVRTR